MIKEHRQKVNHGESLCFVCVRFFVLFDGTQRVSLVLLIATNKRAYYRLLNVLELKLPHIELQPFNPTRIFFRFP